MNRRFFGKMPNGVSVLCHDLRQLASFVVVNHKVSGSYISRAVWPRITKFYLHIYANMFFSDTWMCCPQLLPVSFGSNLSSAAFRVAQPIDGFLVLFTVNPSLYLTCFALPIFTMLIIFGTNNRYTYKHNLMWYFLALAKIFIILQIYNIRRHASKSSFSC